MINSWKHDLPTTTITDSWKCVSVRETQKETAFCPPVFNSVADDPNRASWNFGNLPPLANNVISNKNVILCQYIFFRMRLDHVDHACVIRILIQSKFYLLKDWTNVISEWTCFPKLLRSQAFKLARSVRALVFIEQYRPVAHFLKNNCSNIW